MTPGDAVGVLFGLRLADRVATSIKLPTGHNYLSVKQPVYFDPCSVDRTF